MLTCLQHQHGDQIHLCFEMEAREELAYATDEFVEEEDEDDIGLEGAQVFMKEQQQKIEGAKLSSQQWREPKIIDEN